MAESPPQTPQSRRSPTSDRHQQVIEYWCSVCDKRVYIESLADSLAVCSECNNDDLVVSNNDELSLVNRSDNASISRSILFLVQTIGSLQCIGDDADDNQFQEALRNLAENDDGGNMGAPPAAESAIAGLKNIKIEFENEAVHCAVCLDMVYVGETVKELPCGHGDHGDCIVPWLSTRNTCPLCRFELHTNDAE